MKGSLRTVLSMGMARKHSPIRMSIGDTITMGSQKDKESTIGIMDLTFKGTSKMGCAQDSGSFNVLLTLIEDSI